MDPFLGEIRLMPYVNNFITRGWAPCQGQLLSISQNTALFSLLGIQYGGDGRTTFGLPDLRGRAIVGMGQGPGLSSYPQGALAGTESVTLTSAQLPAHTHSLSGSVPVSTDAGTQSAPTSGYFAREGSEAYGPTANNGNMAPMLSGTTQPVGSSQAHDNHMPYLGVGYFIALQGVFPQRP